MRIISINVNGIKQAAKHGLFNWLTAQNADVVCLQDTRASSHETLELTAELNDYFAYATEGMPEQQSGVAILAKTAPKAIITNLAKTSVDEEGRFIQADFERISVASLLFPSGIGDAVAMAQKARFMQDMLEYLYKQTNKRRNYIYASSVFIAHKKSDVKFWRTAQHEIGFLPAERAWLDELIHDAGYIDALRCCSRDTDQFSYFANSSQDENLRLGWRFDYQLLTPGIKNTVRSARVIRNTNFGGHCPVQVDYDWLLS